MEAMTMHHASIALTFKWIFGAISFWLTNQISWLTKAEESKTICSYQQNAGVHSLTFWAFDIEEMGSVCLDNRNPNSIQVPAFTQHFTISLTVSVLICLVVELGKETGHDHTKFPLSWELYQSVLLSVVISLSSVTLLLSFNSPLYLWNQ